VTVPADDAWRWIGTDDGETVISEVDTRYVTHINFAFGMIESYQFMENQPGQPIQENGIVLPQAYIDPSDNLPHYRVTLTGWIEEKSTLVDGRPYLKALVSLKEQKPELQVLLSVGGWDSDGFCYMAKSADGRAEFIQSCIDIIKEYQIDGVDIDWEYPTNGGWRAIASCYSCVADAGKLILEARAAFDSEFGKGNKMLTIASGATQPWASGDVFAALDYVNVMTYDNDPGTGRPQSSMSYSKEGMKVHLDLAGDTPENRSKLNLGVPFYNEGGPYLVPYHRGWDKTSDTSPEIIQTKMKWLKTEGFGGGFYWAYSMDVFSQDVTEPDDPNVKILQRTLYEQLNGTGN
jgi:GH18 family chitinase